MKATKAETQPPTTTVAQAPQSGVSSQRTQQARNPHGEGNQRIDHHSSY